jgi:hypothetical protein
VFGAGLLLVAFFVELRPDCDECAARDRCDMSVPLVGCQQSCYISLVHARICRVPRPLFSASPVLEATAPARGKRTELSSTRLAAVHSNLASGV